MESPGEDIWVLVRETFVENLGLESPMSDNLKPQELMKNKETFKQ